MFNRTIRRIAITAAAMMVLLSVFAVLLRLTDINSDYLISSYLLYVVGYPPFYGAAIYESRSGFNRDELLY